MNQDTSNMYKGDNSNSNQNPSLSTNSTQQQHQQRFSSNNRSRGNQNDRQHNNGNSRRSSNYNNNRNNHRNRQTIDPNITSSNPSSNSGRDTHSFIVNNNLRATSYHSRSTNVGGNRYDQGIHYGSNNYNQRTNQPPLNESILNSMDEFPSLDDSTISRTKTLSPENILFSPQSALNPTPLVMSSNNNNIGFSGSHISNQPVNYHHNYGHHHNPRHYNNRRSGYNKHNSSRDNHGNHNKNYNNRSNNATTSNIPQHQMSQQGAPSSRSRNNRRSTNVSNFDHSRRNREYNQLPHMLNGLRIGMNHPNSLPIPYITAHTNPYQPQMISPAMSAQNKVNPNIPGVISANVSGSSVSPKDNSSSMAPNMYSNKGPCMPGESSQDLLEADQYKSLTTNSSLPKEEQVKNQIEFYFCNNNLKNDGFLRTQMDNQGWVDVDVILKFNRISKLQINKDTFISIVKNTNKLECQVIDGIVKIRRSIDPEKWTSNGLEIQKRELYLLYPDMEQMMYDHLQSGGGPSTAIYHSTNGTNITTPTSHMQPLPYGVPINRYATHPMAPPPTTFVNGYLHPQVALNYGVYSIDDLNGTVNLVYDPNLPAPYEMAPVPASNFQDMINSVILPPVTTNSNIPGHFSGVQHENNTPSDVNSSVTFEGSNVENAMLMNPQSNIFSNAVAKSIVKKDKNVVLQQENSSDFQLDDNEYKDLFVKFIEERNKFDTTKDLDLLKKLDSTSNRLYCYWTHSLVLKFDQDKYDCFRKIAVEDAKKQKRDGITMLYQFYERFLHRYPFSISYNDSKSTEHKKDILPTDSLNELSLRIFDDFQTESLDDYTQNECVAGLKKLVRFNNQFSNPSRQTPPFKNNVQQLINKLGLNDSFNVVSSFSGNSENNTKSDQDNDQSIVSPSKDYSTHH